MSDGPGEKKDSGSPKKKSSGARSIEEREREYRSLIEKFQSMNDNNAYDAMLEYLMSELAKLDQEKAEKRKKP